MQTPIPAFTKMLTALSKILTKVEIHATTRKIEPTAFLTARLYPDMFNFTKQVQLTCDFAARATARLAGADVPSFPDTETTFEELQARITKARDYIATFTEERFDGAETRQIILKQRGADVSMTGAEYLALYSLPNFYFHATTAYNILRHGGVELGKGDFMGA